MSDNAIPLGAKPIEVDEEGIPLITEAALQDPGFLRAIIALLIARMNPRGRTVLFPRKIFGLVQGANMVTLHDTENDTVMISIATDEEIAEIKDAEAAIAPTDKTKWN